jgi:hypothetical protein
VKSGPWQSLRETEPGMRWGQAPRDFAVSAHGPASDVWSGTSNFDPAASILQGFNFLFFGGVPGRVFMNRRHCSSESRSVLAKVFLVDYIVIHDDEGHHSR